MLDPVCVAMARDVWQRTAWAAKFPCAIGLEPGMFPAILTVPNRGNRDL